MYPNLKIQMWRVGIRQNRLAQMLSVDETTLSRVVNGFRKPTDEMQEKIAGLLQCDQEWLFQEATPTPPFGQSAPKTTIE
jgi:transcriptional regulator with XRE-family HTH domain